MFLLRKTIINGLDEWHICVNVPEDYGIRRSTTKTNWIA